MPLIQPVLLLGCIAQICLSLDAGDLVHGGKMPQQTVPQSRLVDKEEMLSGVTIGA